MPATAIPWPHELPWLALAAGLVLLVLGADLLVRGAVWVALALGLSRMSVGLTVVAIGTSLPEMLVSLTAARRDHAAIAMANVIGSNTANVLLIVGTAAAIRAIRLTTRWLELLFLLLATALAAVPFLGPAAVDRPLALVMVAMLVVFCALLLRRERTHLPDPGQQHHHVTSPAGWLTHVALLGAGLLLLAWGADWLVEGAVVVARRLGVGDAIIGMTILAVGTSLPEFATSAVAAARGQPEIAVGNILGSNIFNVGAVLGFTALLQPFAVDTRALGGLMVATAVSALALVASLRLRGGVSRPCGCVFLGCYVAFVAWETTRTAAD